MRAGCFLLHARKHRLWCVLARLRNALRLAYACRRTPPAAQPLVAPTFRALHSHRRAPRRSAAPPLASPGAKRKLKLTEHGVEAPPRILAACVRMFLHHAHYDVWNSFLQRITPFRLLFDASCQNPPSACMSRVLHTPASFARAPVVICLLSTLSTAASKAVDAAPTYRNRPKPWCVRAPCLSLNAYDAVRYKQRHASLRSALRRIRLLRRCARQPGLLGLLPLSTHPYANLSPQAVARC